MEDNTTFNGFDLGFLPEDEAAAILGSDTESPDDSDETDTSDNEDVSEEEDDENNVTDETEESQEEVGNGKKKTMKNASSEKKGSPNQISSIAQALKDAGILQNLTDEDISKMVDDKSWQEMFQKEIDSRRDDESKFYKEAYMANMPAEVVNGYQQTMQILEGIGDEDIEDEVNGEELRKNLIIRNYMNGGMSQEKATKWAEKSINSGDDIEDAKEALQSMKDYYTEMYNIELEKNKAKAENDRKEIQKQSEALKKSILEDEKVFGELEVDTATRKKIFDNISVANHKVGREYLTNIQQYQREHPTEWLKYMGLFYTMTDGFTNLKPLIQSPVKKAVKKNISSLQRVLESTARESDGSLKFASGTSADTDFLLNGDWSLDPNQ